MNHGFISACAFFLSTICYAETIICRIPQRQALEPSTLSVEINGDTVLVRDLTHQDVPFHVFERNTEVQADAKWLDFDLHASDAAYTYSVFETVSLPRKVALGLDRPKRFNAKYTTLVPGDHKEWNMNCEFSASEEQND